MAVFGIYALLLNTNPTNELNKLNSNPPERHSWILWRSFIAVLRVKTFLWRKRSVEEKARRASLSI